MASDSPKILISYDRPDRELGAMDRRDDLRGRLSILHQSMALNNTSNIKPAFDLNYGAAAMILSRVGAVGPD